MTKIRFKTRYLFIFSLLLTGFAYLVIFMGLGLFGFPQQPTFPMINGDKEIRVLGSKIRFRDVNGQDPPVIFIHGNNLSLDYWEKIIANLPGPRLISLDLIGFAGSDRPDLAYDLECHRKYILQFMDALGIKTAILVGHSMGGTIAAWTAAKTPGRIVGVVMISLPNP